MNLCRKFIWVAVATVTVWSGSSATAGDWFGIGGRGERGSGHPETEIRDVSDFDRIRLKCSADLTVQVGEATSVSVITDDNLLDNIVTEVIRGHTLLVDSKGSYRTRRGVLVKITVPSLTLLEIDGSGDVEISNLAGDEFEIDLDGSGDIRVDGEVKELSIDLDGSGEVVTDDFTAEIITIRSDGSGDIELRGSTQRLDIALHGSGDVHARRLKATDAVVRIYGSGDVDAYSENDFEGAIYGSGDINVYGNPKNLDRHVSGSGEISRR